MILKTFSVSALGVLVFLCLLTVPAEAAELTKVIAEEELETIAANEISSVWLSAIRDQYHSGYVRIEEKGYRYPIISDYVIKGGSIYYAPIDRKTNVVSSPKLLSRKPKQFLVSNGGVAYDGKKVFYRGKVVARSRVFKELSFDRYAFANSLYQIKDHLGTKVPRYELQKEFTKVNVAKLKAVSELQTMYSPVADGGYSVQWYRDGKYFYCLEGKGVTRQQLREPVHVEFVQTNVIRDPATGLDAALWLRVDNPLVRGHIQFVEQKTGKRFSSFCKPI